LLSIPAILNMAKVDISKCLSEGGWALRNLQGSPGEENVFLFLGQLSLRVTISFVEFELDPRSYDCSKLLLSLNHTFLTYHPPCQTHAAHTIS
jgi:hypothetical protein